MVAVFGVARTQAQGDKLGREPVTITGQNSQTMNLLEGHLNADSLRTLIPDLAVVDGSALVSQALDPADTYSDVNLTSGGQISTYIVRDGDTLSSIAKMFGVTVNTIAWGNDIKGGRISPGQSLVILPISGVKHTVVKGDTIQSIAKKYSADAGDILAYNGLSLTDKLSPGDEIIVPDGELTTTTSATAPGGSSGLPSYSGYYIRPVVGGRKTQGIHGHNGVDLGGLPVGSPIIAAASGTVIVAKVGGWNGGYGSYVVISHPNGTQTLYAHLSAVLVSVGNNVSQGQPIGALGSTGKSTGPHLHFEVRGAKNPF